MFIDFFPLPLWRQLALYSKCRSVREHHFAVAVIRSLNSFDTSLWVKFSTTRPRRYCLLMVLCQLSLKSTNISISGTLFSSTYADQRFSKCDGETISLAPPSYLSYPTSDASHSKVSNNSCSCLTKAPLKWFKRTFMRAHLFGNRLGSKLQKSNRGSSVVK